MEQQGSSDVEISVERDDERGESGRADAMPARRKRKRSGNKQKGGTRARRRRAEQARAVAAVEQ